MTNNLKIKELENLLADWKNQLAQGMLLGKDLQKKLAPKRKTLIAGMGGSIIAAELFKMLLEQRGAKTPKIEIWQNYFLPRQDLSNRQVICSSYSGNTKETLSALTQAEKQGFKIAAKARDGELIERAKAKRYPLAQLPDCQAPRFALFYFLGIFLRIFASRKLLAQAKNVRLNFSALSSQAQVLARRLKNQNVLLYTTPSFQAVAHLWEIILDETAKTPSFINLIPESSHHDPASFSGRKSAGWRKSWTPLFLKNPQDPIQLRRALELNQQTFKKDLRFRPVAIQFPSSNPVSQVIAHILLAHLTSLKLAQLKKVDPLENAVQEGLKKKLSQTKKRK